MKIKERAIDSLQAAEYNPRFITEAQLGHLTDSIRAFGFVEPVVVNLHPERLNVVIGGHQRLRVARDLGHKTVPVVEVYLPLERERELNLRLNKNVGEWDFNALLENFSHAELNSWGFEPFELPPPDTWEIPDATEVRDTIETVADIKHRTVVCPNCGHEIETRNEARHGYGRQMYELSKTSSPAGGSE